MGLPTGAESPKQSSKQTPPQQDNQVDVKRDGSLKPDESTNPEPAKPLAPPPRPNQQQGSNSPDYFNSHPAASLSLEPNPFEQSFGGAPPETPGGTKLPSVAALTSPSSLLPGNTPFAWGGGSLRTGPLSPAMLSAPANDYFTDTHHIRGGFPTPNESSLRTGLTPGGSGSMFPAPSPNSQAMFAQLAGSATPSTVDFHRTALNAAAAKTKREQAQLPQNPAALAPTSQPQEMAIGVPPLKAEPRASTGRFDDKDAANELYMLAQGHNTTQPPLGQQYAVAPPAPAQGQPTTSAAPAVQPVDTSPQMNGAPSLTGSSVRGVSEAASGGTNESEVARPKTRAKRKRNSSGATKRKAEEAPAKAPSRKKKQTNGAPMDDMHMDMDHSADEHDDEDGQDDGSGSKGKVDPDEKRKNFLERNRIAALKCRQRKKQWLASLQTKVEMYTTQNEVLNAQITQLREEVVNLKTLLLAHKDCPLAQQQGIASGFMQQPMDAFNPSMNPTMNPYGMPPPMAGQAVMAGQAMNRRFS